MASTTSPDPAPASTPTGEEVTWFYKDDAGVEQGGFPTKKMCRWRERGVLPPTLLVRSNFVDEWVELSELPEDIFKPQSEPLAEVQQELAQEQTTQPDTTPADKGAIAAQPPGYYYLDSTGEERGPYSETQMRAWYQLGWFGTESNDVMLRHSQSSEPHRLFSECAASLPFTNVLEERWYYIDKSHAEQGPYRSQQMTEWYKAGALPPALHVRQVGENTFTRLDAVPRSFTQA